MHGEQGGNHRFETEWSHGYRIVKDEGLQIETYKSQLLKTWKEYIIKNSTLIKKSDTLGCVEWNGTSSCDKLMLQSMDGI